MRKQIHANTNNKNNNNDKDDDEQKKKKCMKSKQAGRHQA